MSLTYDADNLTVIFCIGDFPKDVQDNLLSTLDVNGFISNEPKFRQIVAENIHRAQGVSPKVAQRLLTIVKGGNLLTLERDAEKPQFGLNFLLNKYQMSLDVVPGKTAQGTKTLAVIGISKQNAFYLTAYEDEDGNYRYAGRVAPFLSREKLFVEPLDETDDILWVDPKKFKKVKVTHSSTHFSLQDTYSITNKVTKIGKKLSSIAAGMEVVELVDASASIDQLMELEKEAKMPSLKEIQRIVKDERWQALREDLSWTKDNIGSSIRRLRQYLGSNPNRTKKVRVLNLLNGVARGGIMNDQIKRFQNSLRKQLGVGIEKEAGRSESDLVNKLLDIDKRLSSWNNPSWTDLFKSLAKELTAEGKIYSPQYREELQQSIIDKLLSKGSQTTPAETSLLKMLKQPATGMTLSSKFLDLLIDKVNTEIQLNILREESAPTTLEKTGEVLIYSAEYEWSYSPIKGGRYGRLSWLVPAILEQTRLKADKWDPTPLSDTDLDILKEMVKKGRKSDKEYLRESNYAREWNSGKWNDADKENIRNEVLERVTAAYQERYGGKLPPFLKDPFKVGDTVKILQGMFKAYTGTVLKVDPKVDAVRVRVDNVMGTTQEVALPYTHVELLPKQVQPTAPAPQAPKREYVAVKEELEKLLNGFQPGNWSAFMHGASPKGTKAEKLIWLYRQRAQVGRPFPTLQEIMDELQVDNTSASHLARTLYERAQKVSTPEGAREFMKPKPPLAESELKEQPCTREDHKTRNIAIDFDKTLAGNDASGKPGEPLEGAVEAVKKLKDAGFTVIIHSHRVAHANGLEEIKQWMQKYNCPYDKVWPSKPAADYYVDDKAVPFTSWKEVLERIDKSAAFTPSIGQQPFWDQHPDGGGAGDYKYPLETLYPVEWCDTWNAYTEMDAKEEPNILLRILKKLKPLSKEETPLQKTAVLHIDPDIARHFFVPELTLIIPEGKIAGTYKATWVERRPTQKEQLTGIEEGPKRKTESPAEKVQEGKIPVLPIPQEGEKAPTHFIVEPGRGRRSPVEKAFTPLQAHNVIYQVTYQEGNPDFAGTIVGFFDISDFLAHVKKGQEKSGLTAWLTQKLVSRAEDVHQLLSSVKDSKKRQSWQTRALQFSVSEDWSSALNVVEHSGAASEEKDSERGKILRKMLFSLNRQGKFEELRKTIEQFDVAPSSWNIKTLDQKKEWLTTLDMLSGKLPKPVAEADVDLILNGNQFFPGGGSVEAKRKVLRDVDIARVQSFIHSDRFAQEPFAVQSVAVRRLETESSEEGLFTVWKNRDLAASLRKQALNALVLFYGVGTGSHGYSEEGRTKATKDLLREAAGDPDVDIRALAYSLMKDPSVDFLPWTHKGDLAYDKKGKESVGHQPSRDIPKWVLMQLGNDEHGHKNEPYAFNRKILFDLVEHLPKDLVKEDVPPELTNDLKIVKPGKYSFKEEDILPGIRALILLALSDSDSSIRTKTRTHFGLPKELELLKKEKKPAEMKIIEPSARDYIFQAKVALTQNNIDVAEKQLDVALKAKDAKDFVEDIDKLKERIKEVRKEQLSKKEQEKELEELLSKLRKKYDDKSAAFIKWAANLKFHAPFEELSLNNKVALLSALLTDKGWHEYWMKSESPENILQPELPIEDDNTWDEPFIEKEGAPLSRMELTARQPPTTWPLSNPGPGYSAAVPLGQRDDSLLLKDVRQFFGRPEGKWRTLLNLVYNTLFKEKEETEKTEKTEKKASAEPSSPEEAQEFLRGDDAHVKAAIQYLAKTDENALIANAVPLLQKEKRLLEYLLDAAVQYNLVKTVDAVFHLPYPAKPSEDDIHVTAIESFFKLNAVRELSSVLWTPWHPVAIKYLIQLGQVSALKTLALKVSDRPMLQRNLVLNLGEDGDIPFLQKMLESPNEGVRLQVIEWLKYHKRIDVLKDVAKTEKDPKIKATVEKYLALVNESPSSGVMEEFTPQELEKKISELIKTALDAFTLWDKYPEIRMKVLGKGGKRFGLSEINEWKEAQAEIDADIKEEMAQIPTMKQGRAALEDLEKIAAKLPEVSKRVKWLQEWIKEAEEKYALYKDRPSDMDNSKWEDRQRDLQQLKERIDNAKESLRKHEINEELGAKTDLAFRISQLKDLERQAAARSILVDEIKKDEQFRKDYGTADQTWKDYQAYLLTFDDDYTPTGSIAKDLKKTISEIDAKRVESSTKYIRPLLQKQEEETKDIRKLFTKLIPYLEKLKVPYDKENAEPISPQLSKIDKEIRYYQGLENQWFKLSGAIEPYAEVADEAYRIAPPLWILPSSGDVFPEYARGKRLVTEQVSKMKSPWTHVIEQLQKNKKKVQYDFLVKLSENLPPKAQEILAEQELRLKKVFRISKVIESVRTHLDKTIEKKKKASKKEYDLQRKELLPKIQKLPQLRKESPEEYIKVRREMIEFRKKYGVDPRPDTSEEKMREQFLKDRWKSSYVRSPKDLPPSIAPVNDEEAELAAVEQEIARRLTEYGPATDEFGKIAPQPDATKWPKYEKEPGIRPGTFKKPSEEDNA